MSSHRRRHDDDYRGDIKRRRRDSDTKDRDRRGRDRRDRGRDRRNGDRDSRYRDRGYESRDRHRQNANKRRDTNESSFGISGFEKERKVEETAEEIAAKQKKIEEELKAMDEEAFEDEEAAAERRRLERKKRREAILQKHKAKVTKASSEEKAKKQPSPVPAAKEVKPDKNESDSSTTKQPEENGFDMFSLHVDVNKSATGGANAEVDMLEENSALKDNWDDAEGYYKERVGEKLADGRYHVLGGRGKGVFSTVLYCRNDRPQGKIMHNHVAIKVIRANDMMRKEGMKELETLRQITAADPNGVSHNVRVLEHFVHRNHLCIVFEAAKMNLREVLKKFGAGAGLNIDAVRRYGKQLFQALRLLKKLRIVHADLKPDNILVSSDNQNIQVCDFGSAFKENGSEIIPTPYLVSRFYRAPEIILGDRYGCAIDVWAAATCLFEIFTSKVMFPGRDNNAMLHEMQLIKGAFPVKILRRHRTNYDKLEKEYHFVQNPDWKFKLNKVDRVTKRIITSYISVTTPEKDLGRILLASMASGSKKKQIVLQLRDLLMRCLSLDPEKRMTAHNALKHPFISSKEIRR